MTDERELDWSATEEASQIARRVRQRSGLAAGALAGAMMGLRDVLEGPPKEQAPVVVASPTDPTDIDNDGVRVDVGDVSVGSPALPVPEAAAPRRAKRGARRRTR